MTTVDREAISEMIQDLPLSELRTVLTALRMRHGYATLTTMLGQLAEQESQAMSRPIKNGPLALQLPARGVNRRRIAAMTTLAVCLREGGIVARRNGL